MSDATVTVTADLDDFKREFAGGAQFASQRMREVSDATHRHMRTAAGHVKSAAADMQGTMERAASLMGGAFGDISDIVFDLGSRVTNAGSAVGGLGVAAGGAAVGVAALGYAAFELAGYADEAAKRLEEAGMAALIPAESQESLDRYREGTAALRTEADLLAVTFAGPLLSSIGNLSLALVALGGELGKVRAPIDEIGTALVDAFGSGAGRVMLAVSTGGASELARAFSGAAEAAVEAGDAIAEARTDDAAAARAAAEQAKAEATARDGAAKAAERQATATARTATARRAEAQSIAAVSDALADELAQRQALQAAQARDAAETARLAGVEATFAQNTAQVGATSAGLTDLMGAIDAAGPQIGIAAAKGLLPILTGGGAGALGAIGAAGPVGAALVAVTQIPAVIDGLDSTIDDLTATFENLPDLLRKALGETLPDIFRDLPDLVGAIIDLIIDLPLILVETIPEILAAQLAALPEYIQRGLESLPKMIATVFYELPAAFARAIVDALNPFDGERFLGTGLGKKAAAEGGRSLFGWKGENLFGVIDLPEFSRGTSEVTRTGLAVVHRGEEIRRASQAGRGGGGGNNIVFNVSGGDTREIIRQIREVLGGDYGPTYGLGERMP